MGCNLSTWKNFRKWFVYGIFRRKKKGIQETIIMQVEMKTKDLVDR